MLFIALGAGEEMLTQFFSVFVLMIRRTFVVIGGKVFV